MIETFLCGAALMLGGLVGIAQPGKLPPAALTQAPDQQTIVHIVSRNETVTVKSGPSGLLYSLTGTDGKIAIADATPARFEQLRPDLYRNLRHYIAVKADGAEVMAYGSVD